MISGCMAAYLMAEMLVVTLCVQFVDYYTPDPLGDEQLHSPNRSILLLGFGYLELVLGFGVL
jgi:hypothetical protein